MNIQLPPQFIGSRIDKALSDHFSLSRNFFHNLFERNLIEGIADAKKKILKKSYTLEGGEELILPDLQRYENNQILSETPNIDLEVKLETPDYMVIYKPKGVLSHPKTLFDVSEPSVVGFLYHRFGQLPDAGNLVKAGLIHRLDKDTDGLMIIAKSEKGLSYFKDLFDRKSQNAVDGNTEEVVPLHKYYRAVCELTKQGEAWLNSHPQVHTLESWINPKVNVFGYPKLGITKVLNHIISSKS